MYGEIGPTIAEDGTTSPNLDFKSGAQALNNNLNDNFIILNNDYENLYL